MNFYLLLTAFLCIRGCNARVVPLNFKIDESEEMDSRITENELVHESLPEEVEILGDSLPDIKPTKDSDFLIFEDKNTSVLEISNENASNMSVNLSSTKENIHEELNPRNVASFVIYDLPEELNLTSQRIGKKDSDFKEPSETLHENGTLNDELIDNLNVKTEAFISNNASSINLEKENNVEVTENEENILNNTVGTVFKVFNGTNNTENSHQMQSNSNVTEVEIFLSSTENITDHQQETSAILDVLNVTNNADNFLQLQSLSNDTEVEVFLGDAENKTEELKSNNLVTENLDSANDSAKHAGVIMSGFEFLINTEVAKNAAKAMEVFNFSDPLTDHIMEENEFHSFLPEFNGEQAIDSENQTGSNTTLLNTNSFEESNETSGPNTTLPSKETFMGLNESEKFGNKNNSMPFNLNGPIEERNKTGLFNLTELKGNASSEISSSLKNPEKTDQLASEIITSKEDINGSVSNSSAVGVPECPPPGWCLFGFLSQDTCAVNEHCLGNRICCQIGCSKTCIEI